MSTPLLLLKRCSLSHRLKVEQDIPRTPLQVLVYHLTHPKCCHATLLILTCMSL